MPTQINKALKTQCFQGFLAGDERIELPPKVLETPIIPFDQSPIYKKITFSGNLYTLVPSELHTKITSI